MTRVDFYISQETRDQARDTLACRIAEKAYKLGHKVYIHTGSENAAKELDDLLWKYRDGSFVPHGRLPLDRDDASPVVIGHGEDPGIWTDVLINLADEVPGFFSRFERVAELVTEDPDSKPLARARFKYYRDRGYELQTHNL